MPLESFVTPMPSFETALDWAMKPVSYARGLNERRGRVVRAIRGEPEPSAAPAPLRPLASHMARPPRIATANKPNAPDTAKTAAAAPATGAGQEFYERVKAVRMPSGRIVYTNQPGAYTGATKPEYRGSQIDYGEAMGETREAENAARAGAGMEALPAYGGGVNVVSGSEGTAFVQPGGELAAAKALGGAVPSLEASLPELTDPVAIFERQQWLKARGAEEVARRETAAGLGQAEAEAQAAQMRAAIDPMEAMRLEAESKYGGETIKAEQSRTETLYAVKAVAEITEQQNRLRDEAAKIAVGPAGPATDAKLKNIDEQIKRLDQDKILYLIAIRPQAAVGLARRSDPFAALDALPPPPGAGAEPTK